MAKFRQRPFVGAVALRAVCAEEADVPVFGLVASRTVEKRFLALKLRRLRRYTSLLCPGDKRIAWLIVRGGSVLDLPQAYAGEGDVIHLRRARDNSLVFEMAGSALGDVGVKGARLALEDGLVVGVANDAVLRFNALVRRVAGGTVIGEERMGRRQRTWSCHDLPRGGAGYVLSAQQRHPSKPRAASGEQWKDDPFLERSHTHCSHLSPK